MAQALNTARETGDFAGVIGSAKTLLLAPESPPWGPELIALLNALADRLPPPTEPSYLPVPFDRRVEESFEKMLALIHQQNIQIAELWRIAADLV